MKRLLQSIVLASLTTSLVACASADILPGSAAPDFSLPDVKGQTHRLGDFAGKVVVLEWTNPDCPFVKKHYGSRNLPTLQAKYVEKGVVWLSICSSAPGKQGHYSPEEWAPILAAQDNKATALLLDPDGKVGLAYGAKTTPHLFVINAKGAIAYNGAIDDKPSTNPDDIPGARSHVSEAIDALLAGQPVPTPKTTPYGCSVKY